MRAGRFRFGILFAEAILFGVAGAGLAATDSAPVQPDAGKAAEASQYKINVIDEIHNDGTLVVHLRVGTHDVGRRMGQILFGMDGSTFRIEDKDTAAPASRSDVTEALGQMLYDLASSPFYSDQERFRKSLETIKEHSDVLIVVLDRVCPSGANGYPPSGNDPCIKMLKPDEIGLNNDVIREKYLTHCGETANPNDLEEWHGCMMRFVSDNLDNERLVQRKLVPLYLTADRSGTPLWGVVLAAAVAMFGVLGLVLWLRKRPDAPAS